jgi:hypothetical protein
MKRATVNDACMLVSLYTLSNKIEKNEKTPPNMLRIKG